MEHNLVINHDMEAQDAMSEGNKSFSRSKNTNLESKKGINQVPQEGMYRDNPNAFKVPLIKGEVINQLKIENNNMLELQHCSFNQG